MNIVGRYFLNIALGLDQFANTFAGGEPDETISSRLGRIKEAHGGKIPAYRPLACFLDWGLDKIQEDHCIRAIERDEFPKIREDSVFDGNEDTQPKGKI
jgi:hypothetical protein